jgi:hypothetical protein
MKKWVSVKVGMPNSEIACILLRRDMDSISVYPKFAEWDGKEWIDIDGEAIPGVIAWTAAPTYNVEAEQTLSKLAGCVENDKCENQDCCYFVALDLLEKLLEYTNL